MKAIIRKKNSSKIQSIKRKPQLWLLGKIWLNKSRLKGRGKSKKLNKRKEDFRKSKLNLWQSIKRKNKKN